MIYFLSNTPLNLILLIFFIFTIYFIIIFPHVQWKNYDEEFEIQFTWNAFKLIKNTMIWMSNLDFKFKCFRFENQPMSNWKEHNSPLASSKWAAYAPMGHCPFFFPIHKKAAWNFSLSECLQLHQQFSMFRNLIQNTCTSRRWDLLRNRCDFCWYFNFI